jgi:hypothetical protein
MLITEPKSLYLATNLRPKDLSVTGSNIQSLKEEKVSLSYKNNGSFARILTIGIVTLWAEVKYFINGSHKFLSKQQKENPLRQTEE